MNSEKWTTIAVRKEDYPKLEALAKYYRRTLAAQLMYMVERELDTLGIAVPEPEPTDAPVAGTA